MREAEFVAAHQAEWQRLEALLAQSPKHRNDVDLLDFPKNYRALCEQLAIAEARGFSQALLARLNYLALAGYQLLYHDSSRFALADRIADFFLLRLPHALRSQWRYFVLALGLFVLPVLAGLLMAEIDPSLIAQTKAVYEEMYRPEEGKRLGRSRDADSDMAMWGHYIMHNTSLGLRMIAGGALFGVGTVMTLVYNGWHLGLLSGDMLRIGYAWKTFFPFVITHAAFEITAIIFSGATGLALASALFFPGRQRRADAVRQMLHAFFPVLVAVVLLFFIAAWLEAFWSARALAPWLKLTVGGLMWVLLFVYFALCLRRRYE